MTASPMKKVGAAAATKVVVMGVTGLVGLVTSRLIIQHYGVEAYAQYGLLASLPSLVPFADLGIAAVIINAAAATTDPRVDRMLRRTIVSALRVLLVSGGLIAITGLTLSALDLWPTILGPGLLEGGGWVAGACVVILGVTLPLTIGARLLVGLGHNTTQIATQALTAPIILTLVGVSVLLGLPAGEKLAMFAYIASTTVAATSLYIAARLIAPQLGDAARAVPRLRSEPGVKVMNLAGPMLVQMLALPIAMQTSRIMISHLGGSAALAEYNLGAQLFGIALQTVSAAGIVLWPMYARARAEERVDSPYAVTIWFLLGGLVLAGGMAVLSPVLVGIVAADMFTLDPLLIASFVVFVAVQAAKYPIGMYMTDVRGLRFQMLPTIIMVPLALGVSFWLIPLIGPAGSVLAVTSAVVLCQVIPNVLYVRRDMRIRRAAFQVR